MRDDDQTETRLRKTATDSSDEADFVADAIGWIRIETPVDVLGVVTLANGSSFYHVKTSRKGQIICGYLRTKYIRPSEVTGARASRQRR